MFLKLYFFIFYYFILDFSTTTNEETPTEKAVKTVSAEEATTGRDDLMTTIRADEPNLETIQTETIQKEVLSDERLLSAQRQGK
jgi:hypothetical protein